ncbi:beta-1,3-galactosyl-O-glycosyl-glycoprotein beta-1,6-N-acetylglucosaminyltransferase-like [Littorina saxatilis]|uniref:beta-1,3-galactosyl-O-glycosyl-glycoprotein beta-1,6-N-acetylglucosaminyltransferase-like n=1 Tax=Littorina saxatilis TaxID=31220 RepID=UPI0038B69E7B
MKLKNRLCALGLLFVSGLTFFTLLSIRVQELNLQADIKDEFRKLSVNLSRDNTAQEQLPKDRIHTLCSIPTDIEKICVEGTQEITPPHFCPLEELSQDCDLFRNVHGYDKPVDKEERNFPLAFGLKMHTSPEQAEQLLRAIYRPNNVYCIHVDKKADDAIYRVMTSIASCFPNVIMTERISFVYGSYDAIRAEQITMTCALQSNVDWKYYLNLAGQEFPLRTNLEMVRILKMLNGTNDIESMPIPARYKMRITHKYEIVKDKMRNSSFPKEPPTFKAEIRKGTQYSAFSKGFVAAVFKDKVAATIMEYFNNTLYPEEDIWATINQLPWIPGGYSFHVKHNPDNQHISRAVAWDKFDAYECRGEYVREVCIFTRADLPWLLRQPNLFANKFRLEMDSQAVTCLEAVVDQRARSRGVVIDQSFYFSLPHVQKGNRNSGSSELPLT